MSDVREWCYLCGRGYVLTPESSHKHTHHAQSKRVMDIEMVTSLLEACQTERDDALMALREHMCADERGCSDCETYGVACTPGRHGYERTP